MKHAKDLTALAATVGSNIFMSGTGDTAARKIFAVLLPHLVFTRINITQKYMQCYLQNELVMSISASKAMENIDHTPLTHPSFRSLALDPVKF